MNAYKGQCGLCLNFDMLKQSHFIPSASYKISRTPQNSDPNPVIINPVTTRTSSSQVVSHLLCGKCEELFSKNGEQHVLASCARPDGSFKLRELLKTVSPLYQDPKFICYDAGAILGDKTKQYLYFASSIFWRASIRTWKFDGKSIQRIMLGTKYEEEFRLYLLGKEDLPENARFYLKISTEPVSSLCSVVFPCSTKIRGIPRHKFFMDGLLFILFLGGKAPMFFDDGALNGSKNQIIWHSPWEDDSLFQGFLKLIRGSTPIRNLRK